MFITFISQRFYIYTNVTKVVTTLLHGCDNLVTAFGLYSIDSNLTANHCVHLGSLIDDVSAHHVMPGHRSIVNQVRYSCTYNMLCSSGVEKVVKV